MWDKREPVRPAEHKHGSRLAIVFSGSPLFTGGAGSGESNIRKWIIENDWLEAIIALPEQMFYNTGIGTYVWIVTNRKEKRSKGKIQLLDARDMWTAGGSEDNKRSLGDKRRHTGRRAYTRRARRTIPSGAAPDALRPVESSCRFRPLRHRPRARRDLIRNPETAIESRTWARCTAGPLAVMDQWACAMQSLRAVESLQAAPRQDRRPACAQVSHPNTTLARYRFTLRGALVSSGRQ